jgi:hypothetical protein
MAVPKIEIDLNRVTRREFRGYINSLLAVDELTDEADLLTGEIISKVIISWPYEQPITQDGYMDLGLQDSKDVDVALKEALGFVAEKN